MVADNPRVPIPKNPHRRDEPAQEVTVTMPLHPTPEMLRAVRNHELTQYEDRDKMNFLIGWLYCAYDVMVEERLKAPNDNA